MTHKRKLGISKIIGTANYAGIMLDAMAIMLEIMPAFYLHTWSILQRDVISLAAEYIPSR